MLKSSSVSVVAYIIIVIGILVGGLLCTSSVVVGVSVCIGAILMGFSTLICSTIIAHLEKINGLEEIYPKGKIIR